MPAHKNQHFVPRCALKPFSLEGVGDAINVFNIKAKRAIPNAPTRGQCARDYLYGKGDLRTEHLLMKLEGHYARIVSLLSTESALSTTDTEWLRVSILVQMRRTELAIEQMRNFTKSMADTAFARARHHRPSDDRTDTQVMHQSILSALNLLHYASDLKVIIFRNRTNVDFVTCDNPAIQTNRLHFQKLKQHHFGVSSSGTIFSMPISPRLSAICYDTGVYLVPNGSGTQFVDLTSRSDVYAINQL